MKTEGQLREQKPKALAHLLGVGVNEDSQEAHEIGSHGYGG